MRDSFVFYSSFAQAANMLGDKARLKLYDAVVKLGLCCAENVTELEQTCAEIESKLVQNRNAFAQFLLIKPQIIANFTRYINGSKGSKFGALGGAPVGNKNAAKNNPKTTPNVNENVNDNVNLNNIPPKNKFSDENIILSPYTGNEKCSSDCERKAKFEINGHKFCGQHTRIELSKLGRLDLIPTEKFIKPTVDEIDTYCRESKNYIDVGRFYDFYESKGWKVGKNPMKDWRAAVRNWARGDKSAPASRKTTDDNYDDIFGVC